jgi:hypothetical protein
MPGQVQEPRRIALPMIPTTGLSQIRRFQPHITERTKSHLPLAAWAN